ncbi:MAG: transporter, partial [Eubacteriales bacterium]
VLGKKQMRIITYYRHNDLDTYFEGRKVSTIPTSLTKSYFNFGGLSLAYGISKRITVETDFGYFFNKTQVFNFNGKDLIANGYGFSNGTVTGKLAAYKNTENNYEVTIGLGLKFPFTLQPLYVNGARLPVELQPSSNAFGISLPLIFIKEFPQYRMRLMLLNKFERNFDNPEQYKFGNLMSNSLFLSKRLFNKSMALIQLRSDYILNDTSKGIKAKNTGSHVLTVSPHFSYALGKNWQMSALADFPFYKMYNGRQLSLKYAVVLSLTKTLDL